MKNGDILYLNGKVLVSDCKGDTIKLEEYEYQDNIKEIVKTENIIEELETEKIELSKKLLDNYNNLTIDKKNFKQLVIVNTIISVILSVLLGVCVYTAGWSIFHIIASAIAGLAAPNAFYGYFIYKLNEEIKKLEKDTRGFELSLNELKKEIANNKSLLNELINNKTKLNQTMAETKKHDNMYNLHIEKLNKIKEKLLLYYEIGKNEKIFEEYVNKGNLEKETIGYTSDELEEIKVYFKNKSK